MTEPITKTGRALAVDVANKHSGPLAYWDDRVSQVERDARAQGIEMASEAGIALFGARLVHAVRCCAKESPTEEDERLVREYVRLWNGDQSEEDRDARCDCAGWGYSCRCDFVKP